MPEATPELGKTLAAKRRKGVDLKDMVMRHLGLGALLLLATCGIGCGGGSTSTPAVSGNGPTSGSLSVNSSTFNFGSVPVGSTQTKPGTLGTTGSSVTVSSAAWNGPGFALSGITFPVTIAAGQNAPFTVTFEPQTAGAASGTLSFISNASNAPTAVQLAGTGVQSSTQHSVSLSWIRDASTVQGYYVYRGGQTGGPYTKISSLLAGTTYTDGGVASGQTYYYVVTALGMNSVESGYSNQAAASIP